MFNGLSFLNKDDQNLDGFLAGANIAGAALSSNEVSNLADIFEDDEYEKVDVENPTLKFTAPVLRNQLPKSTWDVVIAKVVGAYKLIDAVNTSQSQGQLGLALLKNASEDSSKLILYKTKDNILSTLCLLKKSIVYWKPPYLQYRDSQNEFWSLLFANDADSVDFFAKLEEVCTIDRPIIQTNETEDCKKMPEMRTVSVAQSSEKVVNSDEMMKPKVCNPRDVVYRVAKIGHELPRLKPPTDNDSDLTLSFDTEQVSNILPHKLKPSYNVPEAVLPSKHIPPKPTNISVALQSPIWSPSSTFDLNSFAAESRIQNTEVRMNLSKLDTKLDRVLDNVERLWLVSSKQSNTCDKEEEIIELEEKLLELKKENRLLKLQLNDNGKQSTLASSKEQEEIAAALQKSNEEKEVKISELMSKTQELELLIQQAHESKEMEKEQLIEIQMNETAKLREELDKKNNELIALQESSKQQETPSQEKMTTNETNAETIRSIMNQFYVKLYQSLDGKMSLTTAEVLKLTAEIIRKETKAALNSN